MDMSVMSDFRHDMFAHQNYVAIDGGKHVCDDFAACVWIVVTIHLPCV